MKKSFFAFFITLLLFSVSSCGANYALIYHQNQHSTQVHLRSNNFQVLKQVSGSAEVDYIFMIGGLNRRQLYENAYADMVKSVNFSDGSKALTNIVTEEHIGGLPPFYFKRTINVSALVIEFTAE